MYNEKFFIFKKNSTFYIFHSTFIKMYLRSITTNTAYQLFGRIVSGFLGFLVTLLLARNLGSYYFGEYTKIMAFILLFSPVLDFGLNAIYIRESDKQATQTFSSFLGMRLGMAVFLSCVSSFFILILGVLNRGFSHTVVLGVIIGASFFITQAICLTAQAIFQKKLHYDLTTVTLIVDAIVNLILVGFFIRSGFIETAGVFGAVVAGVVGGGSAAIVSLYFLKKLHFSTTPLMEWGMWQKLILVSLPFGITLLFNTVAFRVDAILLSAFRSSAEVGEYGLAYRFFELFLVLPTFVMNSVYTLLLTEKRGSKKFWKKFKYISGGLVVLGMVVSSVVYKGAPFLVFIKSEYLPAVRLLQMLSLSLPLFFITSPLMWLFLLLKKDRWLPLVYGIGAVVNICLNFFFIPRFGALAAAIITGVTELVILASGGVAFLSQKNK